MKHVFLIYGCLMLFAMTLGTTLAESFSAARPYSAALVVLACIAADRVISE
jgi:hypothetical protein